MAKYTEKLADKIITLMEADTYSVSEICKMINVSRKSFYEWRDTKPEFREAIEKAVESRDDKLLMTARRSLKKKLEGYTLTEIHTTYIPDKENPSQLTVKTQVVKQKEYAPDTHAIKLTLSKAKGDENMDANRALTIVVSDPRTAEKLNTLQENLRNGYQRNLNKEDVPATVCDTVLLMGEHNKSVSSLIDDAIETADISSKIKIPVNTNSVQILPPGYLRRK